MVRVQDTSGEDELFVVGVKVGVQNFCGCTKYLWLGYQIFVVGIQDICGWVQDICGWGTKYLWLGYKMFVVNIQDVCG